MKKIFIIASVLLVIVLFFLGIYNFAFKKNVPAVSKTTAQALVVAETASNAVTTKKTEKITAVTDQQVMGPVFDKKTENVVYYDAQDGTVWSIDSAGSKKQTASMKLSGLKNVIWSPSRTRVLTTIDRSGQPTFYEYDYASQKGTPLKDGSDTAVWDNAGTKIFYKYFDKVSNTRSLNTANPDGSGWQKIADVEVRNLSIAPLPLSSVISFWNSPDAKEESKLQTVGALGGEVKTLLTGRFGADYLWSPDGTQALVSSLQNKDSSLIILGMVTVNGIYRDLNIPTLTSKCVWSADGKTVYYALPGGIPDGSSMPNDYQENKFTTEDTFWKINVITGEKARIVETGDINGKYDASNMFLSSSEDGLYFINKADKKLYKIAL